MMPLPAASTEPATTLPAAPHEMIVGNDPVNTRCPAAVMMLLAIVNE
jgi:hypothetical protein